MPRICYGLKCGNLCIKFYVGMYETGNSYGNRFQKLEPMWDERAARGQPTSPVMGTELRCLYHNLFNKLCLGVIT